jgi:hypothetical protein
LQTARADSQWRQGRKAGKSDRAGAGKTNGIDRQSRQAGQADKKRQTVHIDRKNKLGVQTRQIRPDTCQSRIEGQVCLYNR